MVKPAQMRVLLVGFLLLPGAALSGADAGTNAAAPPPTPESQGGLHSSDVLTQLETGIQTLETEVGPYDPQLGEQLLSLGLAYEEAELHDKGAETLNRALYIRRINSGLHDLGQIPILEQLIKSNIAGENWNELDQNYQLLLWMHRRNYDEDDPRFLPIVDQMGRWKLQAYKERLLDQEPAATLREADKLFRNTINLLEDQHGETDPRLLDPLYGKVLANYEIMKEEANRPLQGSQFRVAPRVTYRQQCFRFQTPVGVQVRCTAIPVTDFSDFARQQRLKDISVEQQFFNAKRALRQIVEIYEAHPELPRKSYAYALMHLGDWHTISSQRGTATEYYKRAYEILAGLENAEEEIKKVFGAPSSVPTLRLTVPAVDRQLAADSEQRFVKVSFDVTEGGRVRNVEILESTDPENTRVRRLAKELVKGSKYRPRFENGEPVETIGVKRNIPLRLLNSSPDA